MLSLHLTCSRAERSRAPIDLLRTSLLSLTFTGAVSVSVGHMDDEEGHLLHPMGGCGAKSLISAIAGHQFAPVPFAGCSASRVQDSPAICTS